MFKSNNAKGYPLGHCIPCCVKKRPQEKTTAKALGREQGLDGGIFNLLLNRFHTAKDTDFRLAILQEFDNLVGNLVTALLVD